jgi:prolipoprotein diacylglyceryltransferase
MTYRKRQRREGELIALLFLCYSFGRFFFEFLRGDDRWIALGLSVPQYLSIIGVAITASFLLAGRIRTKGLARAYAKNSDSGLEVRPATEVQAAG